MSNVKGQKSNVRQGGFTLVELLVVIAVVTVLPMIAISNFPAIKLQFALSRVSHKFAQDLRKTQDKSLSSIEYTDSFGTAQLVDGYGIYLDMTTLGNKKYIIYADKQPSNSQYDALDYVFETIDFGASERGVVIKEINNVFGSQVSINFNPPYSDTTITQLVQDADSVEVVFALESDANNTKTVSINKSGLVEVK